MSQITRCPSCATSFKVVADQLRISEGWVRCGQCKEVFDASAHLLPAPPPALLPDVSLTDVRPPPAPVARRPEAGRSWGDSAAGPHRSALPAKAVPAPSAPLYAAEDFSLFAPDAGAQTAGGVAAPATTPTGVDASPRFAVPPAPDLPGVPGFTDMPHGPLAAADTREPVLAVPDPAVPAFLAAGAAAGRAASVDLQLEPLTPFAWRARDEAVARRAPAPADDAGQAARPASAPGPAVGAPSLRAAAAVSSEHLAVDAAAAALAHGDAAPPQEPHVVVGGATAPPLIPAGYELPFADLRDDDDPLDMPAFEATEPAGLTPMGYPALELPIRPLSAQPVPLASSGLADASDASVSATAPRMQATGSDAADAIHDRPAPSASASASASVPAPTVHERASHDLPPADSALQPPLPAEPVAPDDLALVEDDSPASVLQARPRKPSGSRRDGAQAEQAEDVGAAPAPEQEVSFVVAARRKAFWRKPAVRAGLAVLVLAGLVALSLQVAIHERDRIVATDARTRPWLMALCEPLQCEVAPQRQIADVVIDSSSFNKARGDSYQLTLAMKSKAAIPLAMPAVELTLTDAQDQPVLRRVLLPTDLGAPAELAAHGEWATAVSVVVTTAGARVAGYRLLAFYP